MHFLVSQHVTNLYQWWYCHCNYKSDLFFNADSKNRTYFAVPAVIGFIETFHYGICNILIAQWTACSKPTEHGHEIFPAPSKITRYKVAILYAMLNHKNSHSDCHIPPTYTHARDYHYFQGGNFVVTPTNMKIKTRKLIMYVLTP